VRQEQVTPHPAPAVVPEPPTTPVPAVPPPVMPRRRIVAVAAVAVIAIAVAALFALRRDAVSPALPALDSLSRPVQVTTHAGLDFQPALSPLGDAVAISSDRTGAFERRR
jgi:hypothetical protein